MRALRRFFNRFTSWAHKREDEDRLRAEIEEHLAMQTAENIRTGLSPVEARRQAMLKFGAVEAVKESYRDGRGFPFAETLLQDTRYALRRLRKAPAFTSTTILMLALGIGATTSIFTLVHAVLLKSLAVTDPDELYRLGKEPRCCYWSGYSQDKEFSLVSYDLYKHFRHNTKGFAELAAFSASETLFGVRQSGISEPAQSYPGEFVSGNYFNMFGIQAYAGRTLTSEDARFNAPAVVVMSYRLWQQKYQSDPSVIGRIFDLNDKPFTVVGIAPSGFFGDTLRNNPPDFYLPLVAEASGDGDLNKPDLHWLELIGRIDPGVRPESIQAQMRVELKQWLRSHWGEMNANDRAKFSMQTVYLRPGGAGITSMRADYKHWLTILMMITAFVLLIVCANVANLMLIRGIERRRQTSLSMALGAQPMRLVRQSLTESILLALIGGVAGLGIAFAGTRLILRFAFPPILGAAHVPIDPSPSPPILLFAFGVSLITGVGFGIGPAWMATWVNPIEALRGASRSTIQAGSFPRKALLTLQIALSLILLSVSGLLTAALHNLESQDLGFTQERRIVVNFDPRLAGYQAAQLTPLYRRIHNSLMSIPGVSAATLCMYSPLGGNNWTTNVWVDGRSAPGPQDDASASWDRVTEGYFDTIGNPIVEGRGVDEQDTAISRHVAVINEAFAQKFFKNDDPIGKFFGRFDMGESRQYEIVGVAKNARYLTENLDKPVGPFFFLPEAQHDIYSKAEWTKGDAGSHYMRDIVVVTKPGGNLPFEQVRRAIASINPNLPIISIRPLKEQVALQFTQQRLLARLTSFFGILSLILASVGLYGVTAYNAGRRTTEIGVRMALGATRGHILALVLRGAFGLIALGLLLGLPLALVAGRFLGTQLYGMNPYNPVVISIAAAALGLSAFVASLIPALRASRISPMEALRAE